MEAAKWTFNALRNMSGTYKSAASVGIIGGADGPTAIFVTSRIAPHWIAAGVAALIAVGLFIIARRGREEE